MKIYFVSSQYEPKELVKENFTRSLGIFPDIQAVAGKNSISETYQYLSSITSEEEFIWVDADNKVYDTAKIILTSPGPCILKTENKYGIIYGHGGIKKCKKNIFVRPKVIDVSFYLQFKVIDVVGSFHDLGEGNFKTRSIFAEMLKLALRNDQPLLNQWKRNCPEIWSNAERALKNSDAYQIQKLITDRDCFNEFYEKNSLLSHM